MHVFIRNQQGGDIVVKEKDKSVTKGDLYNCTGILAYVILAGFSYVIYSMGIVSGQHVIGVAIAGTIVFVFGLFCMFLINSISKEEIKC
jgi:hypothetical protein